MFRVNSSRTLFVQWVHCPTTTWQKTTLHGENVKRAPGYDLHSLGQSFSLSSKHFSSPGADTLVLTEPSTCLSRCDAWTVRAQKKPFQSFSLHRERGHQASFRSHGGPGRQESWLLALTQNHDLGQVPFPPRGFVFLPIVWGCFPRALLTLPSLWLFWGEVKYRYDWLWFIWHISRERGIKQESGDDRLW